MQTSALGRAGRRRDLGPSGGGYRTGRASDNMTLLKNVPKVDTATQSDLAFQGQYAYAGTYSGLRVIDVSDPANATQVAFEPCNGGQFDVSVWGDLRPGSAQVRHAKSDGKRVLPGKHAS
jgi:LVIVD repeat